jgi:hypothetical protein
MKSSISFPCSLVDFQSRRQQAFSRVQPYQVLQFIFINVNYFSFHRDLPLFPLPLVGIVQDFLMNLHQCLIEMLFNPVLTQIIHFFVFSYYYPLPYRELVLFVVIDYGLVVSGGDQSHHGLNECLGGTHVPVFKTGHKVNVVVCFLVN